jgi:hypothetical protein
LPKGSFAAAKAKASRANCFCHAIKLKHNADPGVHDRPKIQAIPFHFPSALLQALAETGTLRENTNPYPSCPLNMTGNRPTGRFDLPSGHSLWRHGLQPKGPKIQARSALGIAMNPPFESLSKFCFLWS